ncbi:hypothetical protein AwDysgo_12290 [Bacteroidales bacterium]|nr:hypothetical protein AwDysgo_12290 [Bacteroidales bacterium]
MKTLNSKKTFLFLYILFFVVVSCNNVCAAQKGDTASFIAYKGRLLNESSGKSLPYVSITIANSNLSSMSNSEGDFLLKIPSSLSFDSIHFSVIGFHSLSLSKNGFENNKRKDIRMKPQEYFLKEVEIVPGKAEQIWGEALKRIPSNYPQKPMMMVGFYREFVKKGNKNLSIVESIIDVYKASYKGQEADQAKIYKGRKISELRNQDTILFRYQGGVSDALMLDMAKSKDLVMDEAFLGTYDLKLENSLVLNGRNHYLISFDQSPGIADIYFRGKIYIDAESYAIARIEMNMNVEGRKDASDLFIKKKPSGMRVAIESAAYMIEYQQQNDKWVYKHAQIAVKYKCRWQKRLFGIFASNYSVFSELAASDFYEESVNKFPRKERLRSTDVIVERVSDFQDDDFWGPYNVIEPEKSIEETIKKLSKRR